MDSLLRIALSNAACAAVLALLAAAFPAPFRAVRRWLTLSGCWCS